MINKNHVKFACFAGFFWGFLYYPAAVLAADDIEPVIVTATRTAQIADQTLTPAIVITRQDIEVSQSRDVAELLRLHAGIELSRNGGPGQTTTFFVRGTESDHVIVMIDGIKINARTVSIAAIQNISPDLIEQIEIVKGPRSSLYGSEGIGGVVNIITRKSTQADDIIQADAGAGTDNTRQFHAAYHTMVNNTRIGIDAKRFTTDGFPALTTSSIDRGHENNSLNAYVNSTFGSTRIDLAYWTARGATEYLTFLGDTADQDFNNNVGSVSVKSALGAHASAHLKLSQAIDDITQNQSDDRAKTTRDAVDFQSDIDINDNNLLSAGLYYADEKVDFISFGSALPDAGKNNIVKAVFLQDDFTFASNHLVAALRYTDDRNFGSETTYNLDYGYSISPQLKLLAGIGTGFRAPSHVDRYGFGGNPELKAETSKNIELGSRYKPDNQHSFSASLFQNDIDNLINWDFSTSMLENIGRARIRGLELGYQLRRQNWSSRVEIIFQDPRDQVTGDILLRRAKRSLTMAVQHQKNQHMIGAELLATSERADFDTTLPSYGIVNLNYLYRLNPAWQVKTHIENLFDKEYQLASGYNAQNRFLMLSIEYQH
ncbi:MAG: TonB-dependent receptor [Gammaproteobacteria bacterium]|nr:TonB-dependent receptor [Gammaproteobacteria bacterium]